MIFISAGKQHFVFYLSIGLLSLSLLTECEKIRLVGPSRCAGRVEIYHSNSWGTVCDDMWGMSNAEVICRELKCGTVLEAKTGAHFGSGKDNIWLDDVQCLGSESSVFKCQHSPFGENNCGHTEDAGVICSEAVRVVNGSNRCNGRVETFHGGQWKRICNNEWRQVEANVLCEEIYCGIALIPDKVPYFGEEPNMLGVKSSCLGNETSISECRLEDFRENCVDATVFCSNTKPIRLMNGTNRCSGRVEVYNHGQWGTVCDDRWGMPEAAVTCREMNCGSPLTVKYKAFFGRGKDHVWLDDMECTGHEMSLSDCPHRGFGENDCDHSEDAGVVCSETVRLSNGTGRCSGRLEVFHNGQWGKLCNDNWSIKEANIVCEELSCGAPKVARESSSFGESRLRAYTSRCAGNESSISECTLQDKTGTCESISLSCAGSSPLRLVNGTDRCSGRVEVMHDGQWGTVCDDDWDITDAQVVCRAMDCGTAQTAKSNGFFGQGMGDIWMDDVRCLGNETSLLHCIHPTLGENNCGHGEDAGVVCSATIRLINGTDQCSGRVEFHHGGRWSPAYNINWGINEARVVCREMNCGDPVKFSGSLVQDEARSGYTVSCNGAESSLTQCTVRDHVRTSRDRVEEATVECSGNVRLADGAHRCAGRVEFFDKNQWGTVCGDTWDVSDATVVCNQLDCGRSHTITITAELGQGTRNTWIDQIECNGRESTLAQCQQRPFRTKTCNITSVAGVVCTGSLEVRLANGKDECSGRVEVRDGDAWKTVCDTDWTKSKAETVCQLLECGHAVNTFGGAHFEQGNGSVVEASGPCFDNTTSLKQCSLKGFRSSSCGHEKDAGVICTAPVRLVGGSGQCSGRVEIFYKSQWGTVCDDEWEIPNADVVCQQLGCGHAVSAPTSASFGRGTGPIWLDNVECTGQEISITQCTHHGFGTNNCGHGEDAGAVCLGALVKPQITLSPSPEVHWGQKVEITCTIVTEHLGGTFVLKKSQGSFEMEKYSDHEAATFSFPSVDFSQRGSYFCEYHKKLSGQVIYYPQGETADLSVTVALETPSISLSSPYAMVIYSPDKISVKKDSSFSITCSIHSKYPAGVFYLTRSNITTHESKPAFSHSVFYLAYFEFPSIDFQQQGEYTCVYGINISSVSICSAPSKALQITVVANSSSSVVSGVVIGIVLLLLVLVIGYLVWRRRWRAVGTLVQFSNRFGGAIKHDDTEDRSNGTFDGRDRSPQVTERGHSSVMQDKIVEFDSGNSVEKVPEDLAGRVCYELEPLVLS